MSNGLLDARRRIYADHHATTPLDPAVLEAMLPWLQGLAGNPSSIHEDGRAARQAVEAAREDVARALGAAPGEVVFTSGGTEANVLAIRGVALEARREGPARSRVVFTAAEHASVREAALSLRSDGFEPIEVGVDRRGLPSVEFAAALDERAVVASAILASNETGALSEEIAALASLARRSGTPFHTDAVQAVGRVRVDVRDLVVDLLSLSGHKLGGPKGIGALFVRTGTRLAPVIPGGGQEKGRRGGTENVAAIAGLGAAIRLAAGRLENEARRVAALRDRFEVGLAGRFPGVRFNAVEGARLPTGSSVTFPGVDGETLLVALDLEGVSASSGSACSSGTLSPSRVLLACGLPLADVRSTVRFSFGTTTTDDEIERLVPLVASLAARVRAFVPAS